MNARVRPLAAALLLLALPALARAADDGGTRSVFATGAGNRALALGSAYAVIGDDASALLWNPAGLGDAPRMQFQISQAELDPLGFHETFAGFVLPDWRWGAAAVTLRHYGVGGADGRDDRNQPTGTFGDEQTELAFGYGRALAPAWSIGAAARVRRQSLAGRTGSGLGADLGMKVRPAAVLGSEGWLGDLQFGLALQNVIEPAIRLESESVPDPLTVRAGLAFARPFAIGAVTAALEIEKPRTLGARTHAGLEFAPQPWFALRVGADAAGVTGGAALRMGAATFDYTYNDLPTGGTHRAGLSWSLGHSVNDAREAAARAEEERLQQRLAALERERQSDRAATLLAGARAARDAGRPDEALEALATLLAIDSTNAEARVLRRDAQHDRARALEAHGDWAGAAVAWARAASDDPADTAAVAGLTRARAESDRRAARSEATRRAFAAALDAFTADDLAGAHTGFAQLVDRDPADAEAAAMLRRVDAAIARRTDAWLQQAAALLEAGDADEARRLVDRARALDPRARGLAAATGALVRADQARTAERAHPAVAAKRDTPAPAAPSADDERRIAALYRSGLDALEHGRSDEGLRLLEQVRAQRPGYGRSDDVLKREYLTRGLDLFSAGRLEAAVAMWERALQIDPHDARTVGYLARAHEQLARSRAISGDEP